MDSKILDSKRSSNFLTSFAQDSLKGLSPSSTSPSNKSEGLKNGIDNQNNKSKPTKEENKNSKNNKKNLESSYSSYSYLSKVFQNNLIPENFKRRVRKLVGNNFDHNKRNFSNSAWAYLDLDGYEGTEEGIYCLKLLFGPRNLKRSLFNKLTNNNITNNLEKQIHTCKSNFKTQQNEFHHNTIGYTREEDISDHLESKLRNMCTSFFEMHGLVVKVRRLPLDFNISNNLPNRRTPRLFGTSTFYPSYHFISRQRRHLVEQIMRIRSFLETDYNSSSDSRNYRSPFSLFEPHPSILSYLQDIKNDLNDRDFSGLYISLSTTPFKSNTELGRIKRSKLVAWSLVEILTNNERCLKCLWVNPAVSANGTTDLLRAFIPFTILTSFSVKPANIDASNKKMFYTWLSDFDHFPRQALTLLCSPYRFGFEKHFDDQENTQTHTASAITPFYSKYMYENNISDYLSPKYNFPNSDDEEFENEDSDEYMDSIFRRYLNDYVPYRLKEITKCSCYQKANWNDLDQIILSCSEQSMIDSIPRWIQIIKRNTSPYLEEDIELLISQKPQEVESSYEIRLAEFTKLENKHIQDLLFSLYGNKWTLRLKVKYLKLFKAEELTQKHNNSPPESARKKPIG